MKRFACGAVIPDCDATFIAEDTDALLVLVADHARSDHGVEDVPPELVEQILARVETV